MDFITGEKIQFKCDHFIGSDKDFGSNPTERKYRNKFIYINHDKEINNKSLIFCYGHLLIHINKLINILKKMKNPFKLIFHNSDAKFSNKDLILFKELPLLECVYTQNMDVNYDKVIPLPIGLANERWKHGDSEIYKEIYETSIEKTKEIYFNFSVNTNPSKRNKCRADIMGKGIKWNKDLSYREYLIELKRHKYAICPEGNGIDTHRFWECLYMDTIPICLKNRITEHYKKYFPIILLDKWKDLDVNELVYSKIDHKYLDINTLL